VCIFCAIKCDSGSFWGGENLQNKNSTHAIKSSGTKTLLRKQNKSCELSFVLFIDLQNAFGQISIILFGNLGAISGSLENGGIIVNIFDVDNHGGVVLLQVIGGGQTKFVLSAQGEKYIL